MCAAFLRRSVEVSLAVEHHGSHGLTPVGPSSESVENGFCPATVAVGRELKDGSASVRGSNASELGGSVEIPSAVRGQAGTGAFAVRATGSCGAEVVEHGLSLGLRRASAYEEGRSDHCHCGRSEQLFSDHRANSGLAESAGIFSSVELRHTLTRTPVPDLTRHATSTTMPSASTPARKET